MRRAAAAACLLVYLAAACGGSEAAGPGRVVRFDAPDGPELAGEMRGRGETGVVLAHMFPADRTSWDPFAELLAERGYRVLNFDFRGFGDSSGSRDISMLGQDVLAAVEEVRRRGAIRMVVIGASMGGTAALVAASRAELDGVVTLSAPSTFMGIAAPPEVVQAVAEPKLFIAAQGDGQAAATAQGFYNDASGAKRLEIVNGSEHGTELLEGGQAEVVRRLILDFLATLGP
jgi:pimeloyl-ACP methyl ester carboxylesterase